MFLDHEYEFSIGYSIIHIYEFYQFSPSMFDKILPFAVLFSVIKKIIAKPDFDLQRAQDNAFCIIYTFNLFKFK